MNEKKQLHFLHLLVLWLIISVFHVPCKAERAENLFIEASSSYSFFMAHRPVLQSYTNAHFSQYQLSIGKKASGNMSWHSLYHYPDYGVHLFYSNLGHNIYTGRAAAAMIFMQFPFYRFKQSNFNFNVALGPGWVEKKFDPINNYKNMVNGSHWNAAIQLGVNYSKQIQKSQTLSLGIGLTHFSNGATQLPNLGINLPMVQIAYKYRFQNIEKGNTDTAITPKKIQFSIATSMGKKQVYPVLGKNYFFCTLSGTALYGLNQKANAGILVDVFKDASVSHQMLYDKDTSNNNKTNVQVAVGGMYEIVIHRLSFPLAAGFYIYNNYSQLPFMYFKLGVNYSLSSHFFLLFNLKSHFAKADYFAYGAGYRF